MLDKEKALQFADKKSKSSAGRSVLFEMHFTQGKDISLYSKLGKKMVEKVVLASYGSVWKVIGITEENGRLIIKLKQIGQHRIFTDIKIATGLDVLLHLNVSCLKKLNPLTRIQVWMDYMNQLDENTRELIQEEINFEDILPDLLRIKRQLNMYQAYLGYYNIPLETLFSHKMIRSIIFSYPPEELLNHDFINGVLSPIDIAKLESREYEKSLLNNKFEEFGVIQKE